ncbi:MAG: glycosyltransferase WbuB [Verrucomicrobia bacterium]|nr:MAG: glycosyltransferase WbuB [Verrucomicrobiota bacterium]
MRCLLINQTFPPDVMATGQYLGEVAAQLTERGHAVTVVTGRRAYDEPEKLFPAKETWRGATILRVSSTGLGKKAKWRRAADFASFILACCWRLLFVPRPAVVVALTSPPLIAFIGAVYARLRGARFVYWVMDLNPDEAIAAGWLKEASPAGRVLKWMSHFSFRHSTGIIALDRFMRDRITAQGVPAEKIHVVPPWSLDANVHYDAAGREEFRAARGLADKFVVMYSGNHSPCHPLDTLLAAARELASEPRFAFLFIGGGSEFKHVQRFAAEHRLENIRCETYRPLSELSASLSAADLHLVVMGNPFVGLVHPCKIYNMLRVQAPVLYLGPDESHVTELMRNEAPQNFFAQSRHGDAAAVARAIRSAAATRRASDANLPASFDEFSQARLLPKLVRIIEGQPE